MDQLATLVKNLEPAVTSAETANRVNGKTTTEFDKCLSGILYASAKGKYETECSEHLTKFHTTLLETFGYNVTPKSHPSGVFKTNVSWEGWS